jgi:hypothetical protein
MRMKRSRINTYFLRKAIVVKDGEGTTSTDYGKSIAFQGESWPAGGKVQVELYGNRLSYMRIVKVNGKYISKPDNKGVLHYIFENGMDITENDGVCLYVSSNMTPDYKIVSIKPYQPLVLEVERI